MTHGLTCGIVQLAAFSVIYLFVLGLLALTLR